MSGIKKIKFIAGISTEDISVFGLSAPVEDYKIVWSLNKACFDFKKMNDFMFYQKHDDSETGFSCYYFNDSAHFMQYYLLANKTPSSCLIPAFKNLDYVLFVKGNTQGTYFKEAVETIKKTKNITFLTPLDKSKIKQLDLLIGDLEMHTINTEPENTHE